jgi:predicted  nucleic acid-binding Zn-ribbon protein
MEMPFDKGAKKEKVQKKQTELEYQRYVTKKISELSERVRLLEQKLNTTRQKIQVVDENMLIKSRDLKDEIKKLNIGTKEMKRNLMEMNDALQHIIKMVNESAKNRDLKVLEKYINMIDPTRFLTKKDVINIVKEEFGRTKSIKE